VTERKLHKGSKVYLEGQLENRDYTGRDGAKHYVTEVVLRQYRSELVPLDAPARPENAPKRSDEQPAPRPAA
jgi:single-strand DNA-binding protein